MVRFASVALLALAAIAGCGKTGTSPAGSGSGGSAALASKFGTPENTARTFFAACAAADWKAMGDCVSTSAPGLQGLRDNKISDVEREMFRDVIGAATIAEVRKSVDGKTVEVVFSGKKGGKLIPGSMMLELEGRDWKIVDVK